MQSCPGDSFVDLGNVVLRYRHRPGPGVLIVLLHELCGTLENWDTVTSGIPGTYGILRYDMRGSGMSEKIVGAVSMDDLVDDLRRLLDTVGVSRPVLLVGGAVGGATAIRFAARHPDRTAGLIAMAPAVGTREEDKAKVVEAAKVLETCRMRDVYGPARLDLLYPPQLRGCTGISFPEFRCRLLATDPRSLAALLRMIAALEMDHDFAAIRCPTLITAGSLDAGRPPHIVRPVAEAIPNARFEVIETSHFASLHTPNAVRGLILKMAQELQDGIGDSDK